HGEPLHPNEALRLLEGIGAAQTLVYRRISRYYPASDRQQQAIYSAVKAAASAAGLQLASLDPQTESAALQEMIAALPAHLEHLRAAADRRDTQRETIERLVLVTATAEPKRRKTDAAALRNAALACLDAGIPESDRRLRDPLLPFEKPLSEEPRLARLVEEI